MKFKYFLFLILVISLFPVLASAGGSTCPTATPVMADGRVTDFDFVPGGAGPTNVFYQFTAEAGRSYSIEVRDDYDDLDSEISQSLFSDNACSSAVAVAQLTNTTAIEPALPANGGGSRFAFVPTTSGQYFLKVTNSNSPTNIGHYISVSVADTTMFAPRFTQQYSGGTTTFHTQYGIMNTTGSPVTVTITFFSKATNPPSAVATHTDIVPAHGNVFYDTQPQVGPVNSSNIFFGLGGGTTNVAGNAVLQVLGPPGSIVADALIQDANFASGPFIQPGVIVSSRSSR